MAETIGTIPCPECGAPADLREDKRHKLYVVHDGPGGCGRFTYNTNAGQERLKARIADMKPTGSNVATMPPMENGKLVGAEYESMPLNTTCAEVVTDNAPTDGQSEEAEDNSEKGRGLVALTVGGLLGMAAWWMRQRMPRNGGQHG